MSMCAKRKRKRKRPPSLTSEYPIQPAPPYATSFSPYLGRLPDYPLPLATSSSRDDSHPSSGFTTSARTNNLVTSINPIGATTGNIRLDAWLGIHRKRHRERASSAPTQSHNHHLGNTTISSDPRDLRHLRACSEELLSQLYFPSTSTSSASPEPNPEIKPNLYLTEENLRSLNRSSMSVSATPTGKSSKSEGTSATSKVDYNKIKIYYEAHGLFINNEAATKRAEKIIDKANKILGAERNSTMKEDVLQKLRRTIERYRFANEATFLHKFWPAFFPEARDVRMKAAKGTNDTPTFDLDSGPSSTDNPAVWTSRVFEADHLEFLYDIMFADGLIPMLPLPTHDPELAACIERLPKLKRPKPDIVFGYTIDAFTPEERLILLGCGNCVKPTTGPLYNAYASMDVKSISGDLATAELQCCRAGSATAHASRDFRAQADPDSIDSDPTPGPDSQSMTFSIALTPEVVKIYVHWAETRESGLEPLYHMQVIKSYAMSDDDGLRGFRRAFNSIIDWALLERKPQLGRVVQGVKRAVGEGEERSSLKKQKITAPPRV